MQYSDNFWGDGPSPIFLMCVRVYVFLSWVGDTQLNIILSVVVCASAISFNCLPFYIGQYTIHSEEFRSKAK